MTLEVAEMVSIRIASVKGGAGATVFGAACGIVLAGHGPTIIAGADRDMAAVLGLAADDGGRVAQDLAWWPNDCAPEMKADHVVTMAGGDLAGPAPTVLVLRADYLALRAAVKVDALAGCAGVVMFEEPGRSLGARDIESVTGLRVLATVPIRAEVARVVDAGVIVRRLPDVLARAVRATLAGIGAEVIS